MTIQEIAKIIESVEGVESVNVWEKAEKHRIYIELPKLNGGKNWNGGKAGTCFYDYNSKKISWFGWAGARTRDFGFEIIAEIEKTLSENQ